MSRRLLLLLLCALVLHCGKMRPAAPDGPTVVVVCIEALRHDYPDRIDAPAFARMEAEGGRASRLISVFPPNSLPAQAALVTGRLPAASGVVNNNFIDRRTGRTLEGSAETLPEMLSAEPIWATAERQGVVVGAIGWTGAELSLGGGAAASRVSHAEEDEDRVADLLRWLGESGAEAPRLILVYLEGLDDVAHRRGPESPKALRRAQGYDADLARILEAVDRGRGRENVTLFVLGDHGMATVDRVIYLEEFFRQKGIAMRSMSSGGSANVYLPDGQDAERVRAGLTGDAELYDAYLPDELPAHWNYRHPDRVGDLVLIGKPGVYFRDREGRDGPIGPARLPGMHGFRPEDPEMMAALLAWGRGIEPGRRWDDVSILDLYRTICRLLGIRPVEPAGGKALDGVASMPEGITNVKDGPARRR